MEFLLYMIPIFILVCNLLIRVRRIEKFLEKKYPNNKQEQASSKKEE